MVLRRAVGVGFKSEPQLRTTQENYLYLHLSNDFEPLIGLHTVSIGRRSMEKSYFNLIGMEITICTS